MKVINTPIGNKLEINMDALKLSTNTITTRILIKIS